MRPECTESDTLSNDAREWILQLGEHTHEHAPFAVRQALSTLAAHLGMGPESDELLQGALGAEHADRCRPIEWVPGQDSLEMLAA